MLLLFKKTILSLFLIAFILPMVFGALAVPLSVHAQTQTSVPVLNCSWYDVPCWLFEFLGQLLTVIQNALGLLVAYLAEGIVWAIDYGTKVMDLPAVTAGFQITLSLVNLILVMALIIIAFEIILDHHASEAKKKIPIVIISATLINFSLLIAGFLLDVSNVFTLYFLKGVSSGAILNTLDPNQFKSMGLLLGTSPAAVLIGQIFGIFFTGVILIILIAVFATAMARILYVAVLLLLMPLTWGFWVFPGLGSHTSDWWHKFLSWGVSMMPTMTFFIYIALATTAKTREIINTSGPQVGGGTQFFQGLLQLLILGGLMIAGLKTANGAGGITSSAAIGAAGKVGGWMAKRKFAQSAAGRLSTGITNAAGSSNLAKQTLGKLGVLTGIAGAAATVAHGREHELEESAKARYGSMSKEQLSKLALTTSNEGEKAKIMMMLAKQKGGIKELARMPGGADALEGLSTAYHNQTHKDASSLDGVKDAIKENPIELAQALGGDEYKKDPKTGVVLTQGEAAVKYMKKNGVASGLSLSGAQLNANPEIIQEILSNPKFLASLDSNASINTMATVKSEIEGRVAGTTTATITAQYAAVKTARQAVEDEKLRTGTVSPTTIAARDAAIRNFENLTRTDEGRALKYLDNSLRSAS